MPELGPKPLRHYQPDPRWCSPSHLRHIHEREYDTIRTQKYDKCHVRKVLTDKQIDAYRKKWAYLR